MEKKKGALAGVKVANFSWVGTGPFSIRYLGVTGATVVRVETHARPDSLRLMMPFKDNVVGVDRNTWFPNANTSSYGISLDLNNPKGLEIAWKLIKWADVMAENFVPGSIKRWGLDYESVRQVKPDIIYLSTSQMGQTGRLSKYAGWGYHAAALAGFTHISGFPHRDPAPTQSAYTDFVSPRFNAVSLLAALEYRRRTGKGQYIDASQFENSVHFLAPAVMDYVINGRIMERSGNSLPYAAPHGVYPCKGDDRWCAIAVFNDQEWHDFCRVIGNPEWTLDPRFAVMTGRKENEEELDRLVGEWTIDYTAEAVEALMQAAGVAACVVESTKDLFEDPQVKHREFFKWLKHSVVGYHAYRGTGFKLSRNADCRFPGPALGEHNDLVLKEFLGMTEDEIREARAQGAITTEADMPPLRISQ